MLTQGRRRTIGVTAMALLVTVAGGCGGRPVFSGTAIENKSCDVLITHPVSAADVNRLAQEAIDKAGGRGDLEAAAEKIRSELVRLCQEKGGDFVPAPEAVKNAARELEGLVVSPPPQAPPPEYAQGPPPQGEPSQPPPQESPPAPSNEQPAEPSSKPREQPASPPEQHAPQMICDEAAAPDRFAPGCQGQMVPAG